MEYPWICFGMCTLRSFFCSGVLLGVSALCLFVSPLLTNGRPLENTFSLSFSIFLFININRSLVKTSCPVPGPVRFLALSVTQQSVDCSERESESMMYIDL